MIATTIVHDSRPVLLVGGAKVKKKLLSAAIVDGTRIVAADGAANRLIKRGVLPDAVIGDMDSLSSAAREVLPEGRIHRIEEQDSTDFEKCLSRIEAPLVVALGFSGGRLDHQLAVLHGMMRYADRPCLLVGKREVVFLAPPRIEVGLPAGCRVSLFPMAPVGARSEGLAWPLDGLDFEPGRQIGTSNRVAGEGGEVAVRIEVESPSMMVILPVACFAAVRTVLRDPGLARWAAPRPDPR
ncbi:thiamine diphosphokinase [Alisedimentitalea sp. MJ-SS2]|uniref:thiamine diphosphokinase n=1 Tax=Aliisedimentitalea sp. MJ-SS2 TaxID=3049795 RepID=UPI002915B7B6|nr:thiamine diphosphokinase [Alisedimentitalea sp. MJ-SS2]MDU8927530.1 thiamine diphosphokinase [Alisedimentitalea sp. MJ-SS2]